MTISNLDNVSRTRSTCPYCGVGCGVIASVTSDGKVEISGDPDHPANRGKLCSKGSALAETLGTAERLLYPQIDRDRSDWTTALDATADRMRRIIDQHGPESVALYVSGQLLTEDYYVANKLMKGYVGTANIDTNSRLCMSSAVAGHKRAFGADIVPGCYEDLEQADLLVLVGSNLAWCHPILFQRVVAAKKERPNMQVIVIDPRGTATCDIANRHLALKPGSDVALFNGLLRFLHREGRSDEAYVEKHTRNHVDALTAAAEYSLERVADACAIPLPELVEFYQLYARTEKVVTLFSQGVNQSGSGTDKVNSILNCHLLTGRIGRPGMGPFSITGQPNAMGGREVGGLANMLAAHMDIDNVEHRTTVQDFWNSPKIASETGYKAVDLFDAIHKGKVRAIWIIATNPVVSLPRASHVQEALDKCELVVVSDIRKGTDTAKFADILLPAMAWGERSGTVTNSERRISRQRGFLPAPGETRADWWILCEIAKRLGFAGFDYTSPAEIFDEHARLSAYRNNGQRAFDIGGLAGLSAAEYADLAPAQWPVTLQGETTPRFDGRHFYTPDNRARMVPVHHRQPANGPSADFPFVLNTGRIRDQWHTMTRTGLSAKLGSHLPEPYVEIHPRDAMLCGVSDGGLARIRSLWGSIVVRVRPSPEMARGQVFVPIHWNDQTASDARVGKVVNPVTDPISGEPEFKHTPVQVECFHTEWHGFVLSRSAIPTNDLAWWALARGDQFLRYEIAGREQPEDWSIWARTLMGSEDDAEFIEYYDSASSIYRSALVANGRIEACAFVSPRIDLPAREWLAGLFVKEEIQDLDRVSLLAGHPADPSADAGPIVCSCFGVGRKQIQRAIDTHDLQTAEAVGQCLRAGTNCGSCVPEIRKMLTTPQEIAA